MYANDPEMAKKWEKEESIREKIRGAIKQEIKSINEGFEKYHLGGLLDSRLKKRLERAIKIWGGKVDAVGDDYIKFRLSSSDVMKFPALLKKLDRKKNVWIGDKRKKNIWDRRKHIDKLGEASRKEATTSVSVPGYLSPQAFSKSTKNAMDWDDEDDEDEILGGQRKESMAAPFRRRNSRGLGRVMKVGLSEGKSKPSKGDYVKTILGIAQIEKIRGRIAFMKLPGKKTKGYWMNDLKNLKPTDKMEKGKTLWTESVNEDNIKFSKEEMAQLHKDGKVEKNGHTIEFGESINERKLSSRQKKAILIAIEMSGNMTGATKKIEKIKRGLSKDKKVKDALRLANESINEELQNSQGEQTDFKKGDLVKDINPDCPHHGSEGEVTKVGKGTITFDVSNNGKNYQQGDELEKTVDQMVKLKESINEAYGDLNDDGFQKIKKTGKHIGSIDRSLKSSIRKKDAKETIRLIRKLKDIAGIMYNTFGTGRYNESINESDLGLTYKKGKTVKVTHKKSGKELIIIDKPNVKREYEKIGFYAEGQVNELSMAPFSSQEARLHIDADIKKMSKKLGKTSHDIIKIMMNGVKRGRYSAMDISRGLQEGPAGRTHFGELTFIRSLWSKIREKFRKYSKDRKLS
jgi:hypothetical protein